ncbi:MAG: carbohydrate ABC transporter permease, partial [Eisenbergiella sp.]
SPGDQAVQVLIYIVVGVCAVVTVLPFLYVLAGSFATERELTERAFFIIPTEFSLNAYKYIIRTGDVFKGLKNSVIVTVIGTAINMLFTTTLAYPLSRSYLRGRNFFINMVIITMLFSGGMVPSYLVVSSLKLTNTYWSLWLPGAISALMIIIKNYFQEFPGTGRGGHGRLLGFGDFPENHSAFVQTHDSLCVSVLRGRTLELLFQCHAVYQ